MENKLKIGYADHEYNNAKPSGYMYGDRIREVTNQLSQKYGSIILGEIKPTRWGSTTSFTQGMLDRLDAGDILISHVPPMDIEEPADRFMDEPLQRIFSILGDDGSSIYANSLIQLYPLWETGVKIIVYSGADESSLRRFEKTGIFPPGAVIAKTPDIKKDIKLIMTVVDRSKEIANNET